MSKCVFPNCDCYFLDNGRHECPRIAIGIEDAMAEAHRIIAATNYDPTLAEVLTALVKEEDMEIKSMKITRQEKQQEIAAIKEQIERDTVHCHTTGSVPSGQATLTPHGVHLPCDAKARKNVPICTGFLDYFPKAAACVADLSRRGNEQHNPGQKLHWDRAKSTDHADCLVRHLLERDTLDTDGVPHAAKVAWRALAYLEEFLEKQERQSSL
jgi:hypothetical protein